MSDTSTHLLLPYLLAAQAQKHVTLNEALRLLDGLVQLAVLDRHLTAPPASPADGDRHIVASGATGAWAGLGPQRRLLGRRRLDAAGAAPGLAGLGRRRGDLPRLERQRLERSALPAVLLRRGVQLAHDADPTRRAMFDLAAIAAGADPQLRAAGRLDRAREPLRHADLHRRQDLLRQADRHGPVATIGTATGTATYGVGTGATASGATKTVNLGTGGAAGSDTVVNIGSATAGADGTTVVNTPTVTFANGVTVVGMPQANLTALLLGLGGASPTPGTGSRSTRRRCC